MGNILNKNFTLLAVGAATCLTLPASAAETTSDETMVIEEVIVSARRRNETAQETPIAMTVLSVGMLESKGAVNIGDLQGAAPNVLITHQNSGASAANVSIRGLTFSDIEKSFDPTVAVVVDGVFIGTSTGQFLDMFDVEQLEILRGPQGTLFGRNTIGGVINLRRSKPTFEYGAKMDVSYGKYNTLAFRSVVNIPLVEDKLAAKAFYFHSETDGFHTHGITGERAGFSNKENFGIVLAYKNNENFDVNLTLEKQVQEFDPLVSNIAATGELFCGFAPDGSDSLQPANQCNRNSSEDLYTVFGEAALSQYSSPAATLEMNVDLGNISITSITGYRESDEAQTQDFDGSSMDLYFTNREQTFKQFSQEVRAAGSLSDSLDYVAGIFYYNHTYNLFQETRFFGFTGAGFSAIVPPQNIEGKSKSFAVFSDFNWSLSEDVRVSFGGRWTTDKKSNYNNVGGTQFPLAEKTFNKFTPKVGVDYRPVENVMLYASWSRGYRSGGYSGRGQTLVSSTVPYEPEVVDSYEIGLKSDFLDRRLLVNLSAFYADYSDLQQNTTILVAGTLANETIVSNVGSAKIKGFEADVTLRASENLTLTASLGIVDSNFEDFITQAPDLLGVLQDFDYSGNNLAYNPDVTLAFSADYSVPTSFGEIRANMSVRHIGEYDQQISIDQAVPDSNGVFVVTGNAPRVRTEKQTLLDASLTALVEMGDTTVKVTAFGRNLTDDRGGIAAFTVAGLWSFASAREPRTFGVKLGFEY